MERVLVVNNKYIEIYMSILVLGGHGLIGSALLKHCDEQQIEYIAPKHSEIELADIEAVHNLFIQYKPDNVICLAGFNGGIIFNQKRPANIFWECVKVGMNVMTIAAINKVNKVILPLTSCGYPDGLALMKELDYLNGQPHPTVECSGYSWRTLYIYGRQLNKQYGPRFYFPVFNNNFGPRARYNEPDRLKVADSLIKKFVDAKHNQSECVELFGDGSPRREFIYSSDSSDALLWMLDKFDDKDEPIINIGCGIDISIKELAEKIQEIVGYKGKIVWGTGGIGNGQMTKLLDVSKMRRLGFEPKTLLEDGLKATAAWYEETYYGK